LNNLSAGQCCPAFLTLFRKMKQLLLLFFMAGVVTVRSQQPSNLSVEAYNAIPGVKLVKKITPRQLVGELRTNTSQSGCSIVLNGDMSFGLYTYTCAVKRLITSGTWMIAYDRMLQLNFPKEISLLGWRLFDIVEAQNRYCFVAPIYRREFISDLVLRSSLDSMTGAVTSTYFVKYLR
jgi:hypothetical protein